MNMNTKWVRHGIIVAALACGVVAANVFAGDGESAKTKTTWTWSFSSNTSYGNSQTKGSGVIKEESQNPSACIGRHMKQIPPP